MRRSLRVTAALAALALVVAFVPGVAAVVPVSAVVEALGSDYFVVAVPGAVALVAAAGLAVRRAAGSVHQATPPAPEQVQRAPRLGVEFDRRLEESFELRSRLFGESRAALRERLREAATQALVHADECTHETARHRVEAGQWTDDPTAAMFLRRDPPSPSADQRVHAALQGDTWFQYAARETAAAIAREAGFDPLTDATDDDSPEPDVPDEEREDQSRAGARDQRGEEPRPREHEPGPDGQHDPEPEAGRRRRYA